ncbi:tyrosine-type recombinase/integrase [Paenibacillus sp. FSL L8-0709]|uniref:tyrosine-type recombinase/integrase n=1 Tax=Paenibacillus sp. FSL L8-0709 TaxID=2975312 RepID=UPI0030F967D2
MNAILSTVEKTEIYDVQNLINKKLPVKTILKLFEERSSLNAHEFLELISPLLIKQKPGIATFKRLIPLMSKSELYSQIILTFEKYFSQRGYAKSTLEAHMRNLRGFLSFLSKTFKEIDSFASLTDMKGLTKNMVSAYENHLIDRMNSEEIQLCSVYRYLVTLRMFLSMLNKESIVKISYAIPESLRGQGKRSNDYVEMEQINVLLDSIVMSKSLVKTRDMAVILLVMELGCRPIEVANIKLEDLNITERQITLYCIKSGLRRLRISKDLCDVINMYLKIRSSMNINHDYLFANAYGEPLTRRAVGSIFERTNRDAFGEIRFNAKALRHTYATNALDNENDFDEVSASMGHKHRCSTEWYIHRSIKRLLTRTLPHNPLNRIKEGDV